METASTTPVTTTTAGVRYGLLTGLVSVIFSFILFATNLDQSPVRWLGVVIVVGGMVMAHRQFKQQTGGFMSYGEGLGIGVLLSVVSGIISTLFSYVYVTFIDQDYMSRVMETTRTKMEQQGNMSDAQIEQATAMVQKFSSGGWILLFGVIVSLVTGLLIALAVSTFTKNPRPEFE